MPKVRKRGEDDVPKRTSALKVKGRNRICKQCRFTCTDLKEFLHHQKYAHSQEKDPEILESISKRRKSSNSNTPNNIPKRAIRIKSIVNNSIVNEQKNNKKESVELKKCPESGKSDVKTKNIVSENSSDKSNVDINAAEDDNVNAAEKVNGDGSVMNSMELDRSPENDTVDSESGIPLVNEHDDEDDRLIIAEEDQGSGLKQPTRSGNIQNRTYVCNQCEFSSTSAKIFLHHQKDEHNSDIIIYECDICEYATKYKQKLPRHRKLHFTGKDSMLSGSDLDSSYGDRERGSSFSDMIRAGEMMENIEQDQPIDDEEEEIEEEEEDEEVPPLNDTPEPQQGGIGGTPILEKKKRKTRQEVDPGKYFEVLDETGVKYACSRCGNVYKWRKSLNKHWKEKHHDDEMPDTSQPPPGLAKLSQLTHVKYRFPAVEGKRSPSTAKTAVNRSEATTPVSMCQFFQTLHLLRTDRWLRIEKPHCKCQPRWRNCTGSPAAAHGRSSPSGGEQPIDFSVKKETEETASPIRAGLQIPVSVKSDGAVVQDLLGGAKKDESSPVLQCNRCGFIAKTLVDYSSHMTLHLNKRAFKCAECQEHFNGVDELNKHFGENHAEKIHEHKEAIQKIPHGLQQTYHLLKMPLSAIGSISSQDVPGRGESGDSKYLKCSMCNFVAKWPAELQKHAVSHSEERPFVCMVCGSTYKWKWDLVKHFEKSHNSLPNPYKRREPGSSPAPPALKQSEPSASLLKSSPGTGLYGSQPSLYPIASTTEALLDTDAFRLRAMEGFPDEEPLRKKRRLSDTEMPNLEEEEGSNDSFTKQRDLYIMAGALDGNGRNRVLDVNGDDVDGLSGNAGSKISSLSTLREMENLIPSDDSQSRTSEQDLYNSVYLKRSLDSNSQVAISNKMKKRPEMGKTENGRSRSDKDKNNEVLLPYKCQLCEYRARWPSEITQHMKNHSDEKPYHCPRCSYKSKWKWDVVKHLKRCGGGTIKDVIDTSKMKKLAPPNVTVMPQGAFHHPPTSTPSSAYNSFTKNIPEKSLKEKYLEKLRLGNGLEGSSDSTQPIFRSLVNQGLYHCLECPFVANSPAELRRHGVLHSENKPFACRVCGYSSRWKCDLKKHMKTYNHYDSIDEARDLSHDTSADKFQEESDNKYVDDFEEDRTLFKCSKCPYVTYKKFSYEIHVKSHGDVKREEGGLSKFKCKQCDHQANDLPSFLQHKRTHVNGHSSSQPQAEEQSSANEHPPSMNDQISNRTLQKHRRKPIQQFRCSKCPFTCFKRSDLEIHENMHLNQFQEWE
ncbi:hypothetical protein FSP39_020484 [Pinctada imbricata]|uniref:C2H2-type domain-containing protein n=1 Tax=Pinctada imbricata TaxID=66713 RepID=A0AA89BPQ2_PINIB|nr:hypothetical protein FSP39_020484 [Pinctada imbricata]